MHVRHRDTLSSKWNVLLFCTHVDNFEATLCDIIVTPPPTTGKESVKIETPFFKNHDHSLLLCGHPALKKSSASHWWNQADAMIDNKEEIACWVLLLSMKQLFDCYIILLLLLVVNHGICLVSSMACSRFLWGRVCAKEWLWLKKTIDSILTDSIVTAGGGVTTVSHKMSSKLSTCRQNYLHVYNFVYV